MGLVSLQATWILALYVLFNISYSLYLKHIAILDVAILATGYVFRLFVGSAVTYVPLSMWIVIMTYLLALFLALAKRRDDVLIFVETGKKMRKVIDGYNLQFLDISMGIMGSVVIVAYIMYTVSDSVIRKVYNGEYLYLTSIFVILGVLRYLQIAFVLKDSGSPTKIFLKDRFIQLTVLFWLLTFTWILY